MDYYLFADIVLVSISGIGSYYSYNAMRSFRKDIMERVFGLVGISFTLVGLVSVFDAVADIAGVELGGVVIFRVTVIVSYGLIMTGTILFLRWATKINVQRT